MIATWKKGCPVCGSKDDYREEYYAEECYGTVEEHTYCDRCGYRVEMCYCEPIVGFEGYSKKGRRSSYNGKYYPKNIRKRKRIKRKLGIKYNSKDIIVFANI